jgi:hypothetical protein
MDEASKYLRKSNVWFDTSSAQGLLDREAAREQIRMLGRTGVFSDGLSVRNYQSEVRNFYHSALKTMKTGGYCPQISNVFTDLRQ